MAESKFFPKLTQAESGGMLTSQSAGDKFVSATQALARKLTRLDDDAAEAANAIKHDVTSITAHSDFAEIVKFARTETDSAMDYFASVMEIYRPSDGVMTRAQTDAANLTELQTKNLKIYLETDALKVKYKTFLANPVKENRKLQISLFVFYQVS